MFLILNNYNDLKPKMTPFLEALEKGALEQLAGQVASAGIALSKISSPELFYILTGNDFDFNCNSNFTVPSTPPEKITLLLLILIFLLMNVVLDLMKTS